jgi:hypothetical protein
MRVLFYVYPALLSQGPEFNAGWSLLMAKLMRGLLDTGTVPCRLVTARRFEPVLAEVTQGLPVGYVDDVVLQREMVASDPEGAVPTEMSRRIRSAQPLQYPNVILLIEHVQRASAGFSPDVVITFGMQADYVKQIWPDAVVLHVEATAFSRNPYPFSVFFDHVGMYRNSVPAKIADGQLPPQTAAAYDLLDEFRGRTAIALATHDPFKAFDFHCRFPRRVLMPLQVSNYYSFDEQANFRTQFELLVQVLSAAPADVGVIVTEYIQWGEVLNDEGSDANLSWLRRSFPNLIFHDEFRKYDSASQFLLPHVDGLFTISSNLGYQALLHGKQLVCSPRSHLRNVSHEANLTAFFAKISASQPAEPRDEFLAWYLSHYAVPFSLACDGSWLRDYLDRRLSAVAQASRALDGFVMVAPPPVLREHWLNPAQAGNPGRFETAKAAQHRARATLGVELARMAASAPDVHHEIDHRPGGSDRDGFLLINDTRSIDGALHWGCNTVTSLIETKLENMGLYCAGRLNFRQDCADLLASENLDRIGLAVFNGEGSVHHDSERVRDLMSFCRMLKERGISCVLINSVWHENTDATGDLLDAFDIVTVRESASLAAIQRWRPDARIVPDLTFGTGHLREANSIASIERPPMTVLDHVDASSALRLAAFSRYHGLPFYLMGRLHVDTLIRAAGCAYEVDGEAFPKILVAPKELAADLGCVTGRYHGLIAALCAGLPVQALASNTPKIEGMLADMGLGRAALLDARWLNQGHRQQRATVERRLESWTSQMTASVKRYIDEAGGTIETLWQDIAALPRSARTDRHAAAVPSLARYLKLTDPPITLGQKRDVVLSRTGTFVAQGFHPPETWGLWSSQHRSQLTLMVDPDAVAQRAVLTVRMELHVIDALLSKEPALRLSSEDRLIGYIFFRSSGAQRQSVEFSLRPTGPLCRIDMEMSDVMSPAEAGLSVDGRLLGFGLSGLSLNCTANEPEGSAAKDVPEPEFLLWGINPGPISAGREREQA